MLYFGMVAANAEPYTIDKLQEKFPDSVKLHHTDKQHSLEFCPDNTCDLFVTKRSTSVELLSDFALLYLYFFSDYFSLADWRADDETKSAVTEILSKYQNSKCTNESDAVTAQCFLRSWASGNAIAFTGFDSTRGGVTCRPGVFGRSPN